MRRRKTPAWAQAMAIPQQRHLFLTVSAVSAVSVVSAVSAMASAMGSAVVSALAVYKHFVQDALLCRKGRLCTLKLPSDRSSC